MSTQQKNAFLNAVIAKKEIMRQETLRNPLFNSSRKSKEQPIANLKRNIIPVKLPTIVKKTPPRTLKRTSSIHFQDSSLSQITSSLIIDQLSSRESLQPVAVSSHIATIKDNIIKENLKQKAILRCKSPRVGSAFSRSTMFVGNEAQEQTKSQHPLQHMDVGLLLGEATRNRLMHIFNKLDTDKDGHLSYTQLQKCLPANLPHAQMTFFRVLYDIISGSTYFGLQEFYGTAIIVELVAKQDSMLWKTLLDDVDFNYYHDDILELLEEFNNRCLTDAGIINYENLLDLMMKRTINGKIERIAKELEYVIPKTKIMKINRLEFIALLPAIIYIESCLDPEQSLFRFRENSLLDRHLRQALST